MRKEILAAPLFGKGMMMAFFKESICALSGAHHREVQEVGTPTGVLIDFCYQL